MKKRIVALLMAAAMTATCLAGCGQKEQTSTSEAAASSETQATTQTTEEETLWNVGELPIVNEPVTLKVLTQDPTGQPITTAGEAGIWTWLEEKTGIHFEVESYSTEELKQKLPLIMATPDEMPDLFIRCDFSAADILGYGSEGMLLQLDDYIEEYGTNIKEIFDTLDYAAGAAYAADGHIYSLPAYNYITTSNIYYYCQRFLDNAGIEKLPETIEELYDAFVIMKTKDCNGDGIVGNEILLTGEPKQFKRFTLSWVGLNCYWPWQGCLFDQRDDKVFFVPTDENYKYLLGILAKMYAEGMIDNEIFTQEGADRTAKFEADLTFMSEKCDNPYSTNYKGMTGWAVPEKPISSAVSEPLLNCSAPYQTDIGAVSAYTEYPEICMLVLDYMMGEECSEVSYCGFEGLDYITDENGIRQRVSDDIARYCGPTTLLMPRNVKEEWTVKSSDPFEDALNKLQKEYKTFSFQNYLKFTAEENDTIADISTDLGLYCDDFYVGVITGEYDLEKDWDNYVAECEKMRVAELTEVYQASYNRYYDLD